MRSVSTPDGRHLAFQDAFGLTRLSLPKGVKTVRKLTAGLYPALSLDAVGSQLLAWRGHWDSMHHLNFPGLGPHAKLDRFQVSRAALAPDGASYLRVSSGGIAERFDAPTGILRTAGPITNLDAPTRPAVTLEGGAEQPSRCPLLTHPSGAWAAIVGPAATLYVGDLSDEPVRVLWRAPVSLPRAAMVEVHPFPHGAAVLCVYEPRHARATLVAWSPTGEARATVVPAAGPPAVTSADTVLHALDEATVARTRLSDGHRETFALPAKRQGPGSPFGQGDAAWWLPDDGEDIVNLLTGDVIPRKLQAEDRPVRDLFVDAVRTANRLGHPAGVHLALGDLQADPAKRTYGFGFDQSPGDGALLAWLAAASLTGLTDDPLLHNLQGWRWNVGGGLSGDTPDAPWDTAEVDAAFAALDAAGLGLHTLLGPFRDAWGWYRHDADTPERIAFTPDGARRFLAGAAWALGGNAPGGLADAARRDAARLDGDALCAMLRRLPDERPPRVSYHALDLLALPAVHALGPGAVPFLGALGTVSDAWRNGVGSGLESAVRWLASTHPDREALTRSLVGPDAPGHAGTGFYLRRALGL